MNFTSSKGSLDAREKQKRKTALSPMVMGILGAIIIAGIIAGLAVGISAALSDDDNNNTAATTVATTTTSNGTVRTLPENERYATVSTQVELEADDAATCDGNRETAANELASALVNDPIIQSEADAEALQATTGGFTSGTTTGGTTAAAA
ncbi:hypothetical protein SNEBB_004733, partial [Seison nebaliae]